MSDLELPYVLHSQDYTGWREVNRKQSHPAIIKKVFPTKADALAAKVALLQTADLDDRTIVATVTPVREKEAVASRPMKLGPSHPDWQGYPRLTA